VDSAAARQIHRAASLGGGQPADAPVAPGASRTTRTCAGAANRGRLCGAHAGGRSPWIAPVRPDRRPSLMARDPHQNIEGNRLRAEILKTRPDAEAAHQARLLMLGSNSISLLLDLSGI
jgi:hypothetical protein